MFKHLLVPLDGSALSEKALPLALTLAKVFDSKITLVRATDFLYPTLAAPHLSTVTAKAVTIAYDHCLEEVHRYLHQKKDLLQRRGFQVDAILENSSPAEGILDTAKRYDIDCIVMSTHGRTGLARWTLGSVAEKVIHEAPCSVLLVRQNVPQDEDAWAEWFDKLLLHAEEEGKEEERQDAPEKITA